MNKKKLILSLFFLISLFSIISCVSTNQKNINIEKPNLMDKKIDDYNIEISGTENIKYTVTIHHKKFSKNRHYPLFKVIRM